MTSPIERLTTLGQSLWYDNIQRRLLENGTLADMIARGEIRGVTSNPSIFNNAIAKSGDYDSALIPLAWAGWDAEKIFWELAIEDIRATADLFTSLYRETNGGDGYVSLEVNPYLAKDTDNTFLQVIELWKRVDRPNLMVKIPAIREGIPAIRKAIAAGLNINVTLIFSLVRYHEVMDAYLAGLEDRLAGGETIEHIASVASFFVSRVDTKVDSRLPDGSILRGKAAVANAKLAYEAFRKVFSNQRFARLQAKGARVQRPLWASTSTKNPAYPDTLYVNELIGPDTVNTVPPQTLDAFRDHGRADSTLCFDVDVARRELEGIEALGISMAQVTQELEDEGVKAFAEAFTTLLETIEKRRKAAVAQLGLLQVMVSEKISRLSADSVPARLHALDPTLWTNDPQGQSEIKNRMGWLSLPETSRDMLQDLRVFVDDVRGAGFKHFLLLGMGGSSLAPEILSLVFDAPAIKFAILDSTDPAQVIAAAKDFPQEETLYIVSSKSGGTAEVQALLNYFWEREDGDGSRFIAITDPGTSLEKLAHERDFRKIFQVDPNVGGRYSALTAFGLVPAALLGIDVERLLSSAVWMAKQCAGNIPAARNPGLVLGAVMGQAAIAGRDKLTLITDAPLTSFGSWLEQLIAESSGKQGKGILPVDGEEVGDPSVYGDDRLFVYLRQTGENDETLEHLQAAGHPTLVFPVSDDYALGAEFYRWEIATVVACTILGVNAFDQPDVQDSKDRTNAKITAYKQKSILDEDTAIWEKGGVKAFSPGKVSGEDLSDVLRTFLSQVRAGDYVAVNAYLPRNAEVTAVLQALRTLIRTKTGSAVTVGFSPRFLHSTGQMHKGGPNTGVFLQITADPVEDVHIPTQGISFGTLERAQALGDYEALVARGRRILRLHFSKDVVSNLAALVMNIATPLL